MVELKNCDIVVMTESLDVVSHTTGALHWKSINCLGGKRGSRVVVYYKEYFNCLDDDKLECLWVRIRRQSTRQTSRGDSVTDQPTRMKRQKKYSVTSWEKSHCH